MLDQGTTIAIDTGARLTVADPIGDGGGNYSLIKAGAGVLFFSAPNTYSGGTIVSAGTLEVGWASSTGTTGTVEIASGATLEDIVSTTYNLPSGGLQLDGGSTLQTNFSSPYTINGAVTLAGDATIDVDTTSSLTVAGAIGDNSGGHGLTKTDTGTLILTGTSSYSGTTTVSGGILEVDGSIATSSEVDVNAGGTLGGGAVGNVVSTGGTVAPADAPNVLHTGAFSLDGNSIYSVQLDGTTPGGASGYDQVVASGTVSLGGATLSATLGGAYTPTPGDQLTIIKNNSGSAVSGTFNGLLEGAIVPVGAYDFQISYRGGQSGQDVVLTAKATPTITVNAAPNPSQFGQSVTFSVTVSGGGVTPTGTVTFYDGNPNSGGQQIGTTQRLDASGNASVSTGSLTIGTHQIYASYSGDSFYFSGTGTLTGGQGVTTAGTTTSVSSSALPSAMYGTSIVFWALVTPAFGGLPTGTVEFYDGDPNNHGQQIGQGNLNGVGVASFTTTSLPVTGSPHLIYAEYLGDSSFNTSTSTNVCSQGITKANATVVVTPYNVTYDGQSHTATVASITGVNGETGSTVGTVALNTTHTAAGTYSDSWSFTGGANYNDIAPTAITDQIAKADLTITANDASRVFGVPNPTFSASYSGFVNGEGPASLTTPVILTTPANSASPVGAYAIDAAGATSPNYAITFHQGTLTVAKASSLTTITSPGGASVFGQTVTFTAVVSPVTAGAVSFFVDGALAASVPVDPTNGLATFTMSALGLGSHTISAAYAGNTNVLASQSAAIQEVVSQANSQSIITAYAIRNRRGQITKVELDADVLAASPGGGTPTGPVVFFSGSRKIGSVNLTGGGAVLTLNASRVLNTKVKAQYNGDTNFLASVSPQVNVTKKGLKTMARPFFQFARPARRAR